MPSVARPRASRAARRSSTFQRFSFLGSVSASAAAGAGAAVAAGAGSGADPAAAAGRARLPSLGRFRPAAPRLDQPLDERVYGLRSSGPGLERGAQLLDLQALELLGSSPAGSGTGRGRRRGRGGAGSVSASAAGAGAGSAGAAASSSSMAAPLRRARGDEPLDERRFMAFGRAAQELGAARSSSTFRRLSFFGSSSAWARARRGRRAGAARVRSRRRPPARARARPARRRPPPPWRRRPTPCARRRAARRARVYDPPSRPRGLERGLSSTRQRFGFFGSISASAFAAGSAAAGASAGEARPPSPRAGAAGARAAAAARPTSAWCPPSQPDLEGSLTPLL